MFQKLSKLLNSFTCLTKEYGIGRGLLMVVSEVSKFVLVPRHEIMVKLRNGCKLFLIPNDVGISAELRLFKTHEPLATKILVKALRKGMTVVDIGSNIGYYVTLESKLVGQKGMVIAIEPIPVNFSYLLKNVKVNKLSNVITVNSAISNRNDTIEMIKSKGSNWSRVLQNNQDLSSPDVVSVVRVRSVTLDTLIEQLGLKKVNLIRMDVEGYEDYVIKASKNIIENYLPDIFMEIHHSIIGRKRLVNLLGKLHRIGYNVKYVIPRNVDAALLYRNEDVTIKDIMQLINEPAPDVLSVYFTARKS